MNPDPTQRRHPVPKSGRVRLEDAAIRHRSDLLGNFSIPLSEVALIGEFTTDHGPHQDDWFMVFVPRGGGGWHEVSMAAEGMDRFIEDLGEALDTRLVPSFAGGTDYASRIVWPPELAERPLFVFSRASSSNPLRRLKLAFLPEVSQRLSADALSAAGGER